MLFGGYGKYCSTCEIPQQTSDPRTRAELRSGAVGHVIQGSVPPIDEPREIFAQTGSVAEAGFADKEVRVLRACAVANLCGGCIEVTASASAIVASWSTHTA